MGLNLAEGRGIGSETGSGFPGGLDRRAIGIGERETKVRKREFLARRRRGRGSERRCSCLNTEQTLLDVEFVQAIGANLEGRQEEVGGGGVSE